jgi:hypothetical protein
MDIVRRAYHQTRKELPDNITIEAFNEAMVLNMVRWIKLRTYPREDWPRDFGEYPKYLEGTIK